MTNNQTDKELNNLCSTFAISRGSFSEKLLTSINLRPSHCYRSYWWRRWPYVVSGLILADASQTRVLSPVVTGWQFSTLIEWRKITHTLFRTSVNPNFSDFGKEEKREVSMGHARVISRQSLKSKLARITNGTEPPQRPLRESTPASREPDKKCSAAAPTICSCYFCNSAITATINLREIPSKITKISGL